MRSAHAHFWGTCMIAENFCAIVGNFDLSLGADVYYSETCSIIVVTFLVFSIK